MLQIAHLDLPLHDICVTFAALAGAGLFGGVLQLRPSIARISRLTLSQLLRIDHKKTGLTAGSRQPQGALMFWPNQARTPRGALIRGRIHVTAFATAALVGCTGSGDGRATMAEPTTLVVTDSTHHVDALAREPVVVEHPDGTLFVSGYGEGRRGGALLRVERGKRPLAGALRRPGGQLNHLARGAG